MENIREKKQYASQLRKAGKYQEALLIYKSLWEETKDAFDGTGYISCLRKLGHFGIAVPLAKELLGLFPDFEWCQKEVAWTLIKGELNLYTDDTPLHKVIDTANLIMETNPDFLAKKLTIFKVLKHSKKNNNWHCIADWIDRLNPTDLSEKPLQNEDGKKGWSDQEIWYNYKINSYLEQEDPHSALVLSTSIEGKYPRNAKYFRRLKALANKHLGNFDESIIIYHALCLNDRADWWLLHEYGQVLLEMDEQEKALILFCRAALACHKLEMSVKLLQDIGDLFVQLNNKEHALFHYQLVKFVRVDNNWPIPESLLELMRLIENNIPSLHQPRDTGSCLQECRNIWRQQLKLSTESNAPRKLMKDLSGKISIISGKSMSFINSRDGFSAICFSSDLPSTIRNGDIVVFDAKPSFDKKKNKESWRAVNIRKN